MSLITGDDSLENRSKYYSVTVTSRMSSVACIEAVKLFSASIKPTVILMAWREKFTSYINTLKIYTYVKSEPEIET